MVLILSSYEFYEAFVLVLSNALVVILPSVLFASSRLLSESSLLGVVLGRLEGVALLGELDG